MNHEAIRLAELGYWLVPWTPRQRSGKTAPRVTGYNVNKPDVEQVKKWLHQWPSSDWSLFLEDLVVLDIEQKSGKDGLSDLKRLAHEHGTTFEELTRGCPCTRTKSGGYHFYYRAPHDLALDGNAYIRAGVEVKHKRTAHIAPSSGYTVEVPIASKADIPTLPSYIVGEWSKVASEKKAHVDYTAQIIPEGERRSTLLSMAGTLREKLGMNPNELKAALTAMAVERCEGAFPEEEIEQIADDIGSKEINSIEGLAAAGDEGAINVLKFVSQHTFKPEDIKRVPIEVSNPDTPIHNPKQYTLPDNIMRPNDMFAAWDDWAKACSPKYQPALSLYTACATFASIMGRNYIHESDTTPNLYCLGLVRASEGKGRVAAMSSHLLREIGLGQLVGASNGSGDGLISQIRESGGEKLMVVDEFWRMMANWKQTNCAPYWLELKAHMLDFFDGRRWEGKSLKGGKEEGIEEPRPCFIFLSQPKTFMAHMTQAMHDDGFMRRLLVTYNSQFVYPNFFPKSVSKSFPEFLKTACKERLEKSKRTLLGDITGAQRQKVVYRDNPLEIDGLIEMKKKIVAEQQSRFDDEDGSAELLGTSIEKITRLAMVYMWTTYPDSNEILLEAYEWGYAIVCGHSNPCLFDLMDKPQPNTQRSTSVGRIEKYLKKMGATGASESLVMNYTGLPKAEVSEILTMLVNVNKLTTFKTPKATKYRWEGRS